MGKFKEMTSGLPRFEAASCLDYSDWQGTLGAEHLTPSEREALGLMPDEPAELACEGCFSIIDDKELQVAPAVMISHGDKLIALPGERFDLEHLEERLSASFDWGGWSDVILEAQGESHWESKEDR